MLNAAAAVICVFFALIYVYLTWNYNFWRNRGIRGPKPSILKGNFKRSIRGERNFIEDLHEIYLAHKAKEKFVGVFMARSPRLFILDPELALQILTAQFSNFHDNESSKWSDPRVEQLRCMSPFVSVGDEWKEKRSDVGSAITLSKIRSFHPAMQRAAEKLIDFISTHQTDLDAKELSNRFTADIIADFIWGIDAKAFETEKPGPIQEIASSMIAQSLKCVRHYVRTAAWPWLRALTSERFFPKSTDDFFTQLTMNSKAQRKENPVDRPDLLNHLLQLEEKKNLSIIQMAGHSTTVLIDGYETIAIAISHCLLLLGRNKSAQEKLRSEIFENLNEDGSLSFDNVNALPYLDQCVQETLRIFPPLPTLFKLCTADTRLTNTDGGKVYLKPGDSVYISSYSFHRDADIFEDPEEFIPERFDPAVGGSKKYREMGAFLPFGDGPRMCLGMRLGLVEAKVAVAEVVRKFEISLGSSTRTDNKVAPSSFLLTLDGGISLNFKRLE